MRNGEAQEYEDAIKAVEERLESSEDRIKDLGEYTRWVFDYTRMELEEFEEKMQELTDENTVLTDKLKTIHNGHQQSDDGVAKAGFIKWIIDDNIICKNLTRCLQYFRREYCNEHAQTNTPHAP